MWKGTEVAVKMLLTTTSSAATKELERSFKEEVSYNKSLTYPFLPLNTPLLAIGGIVAGQGHDVVAAPQRGAVHGRVHEAAQDVHRHGAHDPRLPLRCTPLAHPNGLCLPQVQF